VNLMSLFTEPEKPSSYWAGKYKIPWDDPAFSSRMLAEHLSQDHDMASRRAEKIDLHVEMIHKTVMNGLAGKILDLGCGPGFYAERLAALGHTVHGIDFSPASIAYAVENTTHPDLCSYVHGDVRTEEFGSGYDLAMILFGEFNTFPPSEIGAVLKRMHAALGDGGRVLLEVQEYEAIKRRGGESHTWFQSKSGLFSGRPHLFLTHNDWDDDQSVTREQFVVIDAESMDVSRYCCTTQAYTTDEYMAIVTGVGFRNVTIGPAWGDANDSTQSSMRMVQGER